MAGQDKEDLVQWFFLQIPVIAYIKAVSFGGSGTDLVIMNIYFVIEQRQTFVEFLSNNRVFVVRFFVIVCNDSLMCFS